MRADWLFALLHKVLTTTTDIDLAVSKTILQTKLVRELSQLYEALRYIETGLLQSRLSTWGLHGLTYDIVAPAVFVEPD